MKEGVLLARSRRGRGGVRRSREEEFEVREAVQMFEAVAGSDLQGRKSAATQEQEQKRR